jgi:hypothetical protein
MVKKESTGAKNSGVQVLKTRESRISATPYAGHKKKFALFINIYLKSAFGQVKI